MNNKYEIGIVGLGAMGSNLLQNIADHDFFVVGLDKDKNKVEALQRQESKNHNIKATSNLKEFVENLRHPKTILLLVPSPVVDSVIDEISSVMDNGDLLIDAGNSHFIDTNRREKLLKEKGINFLGIGISGGEEGARHGPSIMVGGNLEDYQRIRPILEAVAAKVNGVACESYLGPGSAGHYVKMVHNGIEYGIMQLIAETYHLLKNLLKLTDDECHQVYNEWNNTELNSYLLEITEKIFLKKDDKTDNRLIEVILDIAKQKGTGMWTSLDALELQVPIPSIDAAVSARILSLYKTERKIAGHYLKGPTINYSGDRKLFLQQLRNAYYACTIIIFSQGMALLFKASEVYHYDLKLEEIARIWRGGCIIRASLLESIMSVFHHSTKLSNLLLDSHFYVDLKNKQTDLRFIVEMAIKFGIPLPVFMASLSYYDGYRSAWLPANLIEAQRDYFGAHTYERIDESGVFHTNWGQE